MVTPSSVLVYKVVYIRTCKCCVFEMIIVVASDWIAFVAPKTAVQSNRWPLSYLNLIKNMKTYIRRQQHKKILNTKT